MRPRIMLHNAVSADGRVDGFAVDLGTFYSLAATFREDATLAGSETILKAEEQFPEANDVEGDSQPVPSRRRDRRPLLVIPDSRGRVRSWRRLLGSGLWRAGVALCSRATPKEHLRFLREEGIASIVAGRERVDLAAGLSALREKHGVRRVRVDSGGTLNGALLRAGLVDEVSLLVHPVMVGGTTPASIFRAADLALDSSPVALRLKSAETLKAGVVWLRYLAK